MIHAHEIRVFLKDFRDSLKVLKQGKNMITFAFQSSTLAVLRNCNQNKNGCWIEVTDAGAQVLTDLDIEPWE